MRKLTQCLILNLLCAFTSVAREDIKLCGVEWPPFTFVVQGKMVKGISLDVYREAFRRLSHNSSTSVLPWARCKLAVIQGDEQHAMIDNAALAPFVFGEHPTGVYPLVLYVREGFPVDTFSWPAMVGKRIGMVRGYDYTEKILAFDGWNKDFANDDEQMIIKLKAKRYDYILSDLFSAPILAQKVGIKLKMLKPSVDATYTYLVFNQEKIAVAAQFDRIVGEMIEDGTMVAIYAKYGYSYQTLMQLGQPADTSLKP